jgi:hypothetical protein
MTIRVADCRRPVHPLDGDHVLELTPGGQDVDRLRAREAHEKLKALRKTTTLGPSWEELSD